jgi:DNA-binding NarL/FixJ family response regulator
MTIRLLLVDDHEVVRRGLRELLESEDDLVVVAEAGSVAEATADGLVEVDVAVLDVRLPDGSGIEVCRWLKERSPATSSLMLTSFADDEALFAAIMAGASGYVLKEIRGSELVSAIRKVAIGGSLLDPVLVAQVRERLKARAAEEERLARLSPQERKILDLIAEGLTNRQIGEELFLAEKTVKNYVSNLLAKLGFARRTEAAVFATKLAEEPGG